MTDEQCLHLALALAREAENAGEVPVGAVVVWNGEVIGKGRNSPISTQDPTAHAEILAIRQAAHHIQNYRLEGATIYTTLEPCLANVRGRSGRRAPRTIESLVRGTFCFGGVRSKFRLADSDLLNHQVEVKEGILGAECSELLRDFFARRRS